ncbi:MAG: DNA polymerase Y family protein [Planctomycetota bacterium]
MACVDVPFLPLQILLRRERGWRELPVAVVESDGPQARIAYVNRHARRHGVLPGMRYASGLALTKDLHAGVVVPSEVVESRDGLVRELQRFSPGVEPALDEPGVFWLDAKGMDRLVGSRQVWGSYECWAEAIRAALTAHGWVASVAVGFSRFGTYAAARSRAGKVRVFVDAASEGAQARRTSLSLLCVDPASRELLAKLGVETVGQLLELPAAGVRRRFGEELWHVLELARGTSMEPFSAQVVLEPLRARTLFDEAVAHIDTLLLAIESMLLPILERLAERGQALTQLALELVFERSPAACELIRTAEPQLDAGRILGLVLLRLEGLRLDEGAIELGLEVQCVSLQALQGELFAERPPRDLAAGNRALARLRARFGNDCVSHAVLEEGHLPEACFQWQPCEQLSVPRPPSVKLPVLVRRCYRPAIMLPPRGRHEPDGWLLGGAEAGSVTKLTGPYVIAGGWWNRAVHREYYFAETRSGAIYWIYYGRPQRRWFIQGIVS